MKKFILIIGLAALLCLSTGLALADNGPHGNYTPLTDACAGCHRAHTAGGPSLLLASTVYGLCFTCHGSAATGANTNVEDGQYVESNYPGPVDRGGVDGTGVISRGLKGGGFVNTVMASDWPNPNTVPTSTMSSHTFDGSAGTIWGYGNYTAITNTGLANFNLTCVSCHNPHGGDNGGAATYRLLRIQPLGPISNPVAAPVGDETGSWWYTLRDTTFQHITYPMPNTSKTGNQYFGEGYVNGTAFPGQMDTQEAELTPWCSQCHKRHQATPVVGGPGDVSSGDALFTFRHLADGQPADCSECHGPPWTLATTRGGWFRHTMECMTCHVAHGSSAKADGYADGNFDPGGPGVGRGPILAGDSSLLRIDNRGVCQACHGK